MLLRSNSIQHRFTCALAAAVASLAGCGDGGGSSSLNADPGQSPGAELPPGPATTGDPQASGGALITGEASTSGGSASIPTSGGSAGTPTSGGSPGQGGGAGNGGSGGGSVQNGTFSSGDWHGSAWTAAVGAGSTISPSDFGALPPGSPFCASGTVAPDPNWGGVGIVGFNLNQGPERDAAEGTVTPTGDGVVVGVTNRSGSTLRVQIQGPSGATDAEDRWCAALTGAGGFIPWSAFNTRCWDGSGSGYQNQPLSALMVLVPGSNTASIPFDFCVDSVAQHAGGGGTGGTGGSGGAPGAGPVGYYGQLNCGADARLHGARTNAIAQVRGMSFFWSNWSSALWREDVVDRMVDEFKAEIIRLPMGVDNAGNPYDWGDEDRVKRLVAKARERGIYVIIDWHSHGASNNPGAARDFFGRMSAEFGQLDNVLFELFNEPIDQSWDQVKAYAEQVLPAIRAHSDNLVLVGTPSYSQAVDWASGNPLADGNVAYVLHFYAASHHSELRAKGDVAMNAGRCVFVSEWGATHADGGSWANGHGGLDYWSTSEWLGWMDQRNISWANWSIMNKEESSSIFNPGTENLSEAGNYLKGILSGYVESNPWR